MIDSAVQIISQVVSSQYIGKNHYQTGKGKLNWGGQDFHYQYGVVINTALSFKPQNMSQWRIVAYHGTDWCNLKSILQLGLLPGNPNDCQTFNGNVYGAGIYCSPFQSYAKIYNRGTTKTLLKKKVRLVLGLRIKNQAAITKTSDEKIWLIKNKNDVSVQDINLTFDQCMLI